MTATPKCSDCPSYKTGEWASESWHRNPGAPMCSRFGHILGRPGLSPQESIRVEEQYASHCPNFGDPEPVRYATDLDTRVARPGNFPESTDSEKSQVQSCANCVHFISEEFVVDKFGWTLPMCEAKGKLLFTPRWRFEAEGCPYACPGMADPSRIDTVQLRPVFDPESPIHNPVASWLAAQRKSAVVDPTQRESDAPVSDEDRASGIRAWFKVGEAEMTGEPIYISSYDPMFFPPEQRALIPKTGSTEHPENYIDHAGILRFCAESWLEDMTPVLWGPPGTGKTEAARFIAWMKQVPFHRFSLAPDTDPDELLGKMWITAGDMVAQLGRMTTAYTEVGVILLDEPNSAPDEVWMRLRPLTDNSKQMVADWLDGRVINKADECCLMMAMNESSDARNTRITPLADADGQRLDSLKVEYPPADVEKAILYAAAEASGWTPPDELINVIMKLSDEFRAMSEDGTLPDTWGVRNNVAVVKMARYRGLLRAYRSASADRDKDPEVRDLILNAVKKYVDGQPAQLAQLYGRQPKS